MYPPTLLPISAFVLPTSSLLYSRTGPERKLRTKANAYQFDAITSPDKATFIADQVNATAAGLETFTVIDTFHVCDRLVFNWKGNSTPIPLTGMDIIYFLKAKSGKFQIIKGVSEFNNAAVLFNAGVFPCPTTPAAPAATA